jgi:hypothetical protein
VKAQIDVSNGYIDERTCRMATTQTRGDQSVSWRSGTAWGARRTLTRVLPQRSLADDPSARCVVDYSLARRAALRSLQLGRMRPEDACDAHVYLRRAARYHGAPTDRMCPVCRAEHLIDVTYAFGDCFPDTGNGRARANKELRELAGVLPDFSVFVVEVCLGCGWNYLVTSFVLGTGEPVTRRRSRSSSGSRS